MKKLGLVCIHGMGPYEPEYHRGFEEAMSEAMGEEWERVAFHPIQYAPVLQEPQNRFWEEVNDCAANDLDGQALRRYLLYGIGDAAALELSAHTDRATYEAVQREIQRSLTACFAALGEDPTRPLILVAHSLGCQIASNYLWDADKGLGLFADGNHHDPLGAFLRGRSLKRLFTLGCNIPLFAAGIQDRRCFTRPCPEMEWNNYYDPDDILGWPLKQLGPSYEFIHDHPINAGGLLTSWNLLSHAQYWSDADVITPIARAMKDLL
ncbi:MAG: hypothetical protein ACYTGH_12095 [Planctomycetota bacterium]|jgi:hypothetical protein